MRQESVRSTEALRNKRFHRASALRRSDHRKVGVRKSVSAEVCSQQREMKVRQAVWLGAVGWETILVKCFDKQMVVCT